MLTTQMSWLGGILLSLLKAKKKFVAYRPVIHPTPKHETSSDRTSYDRDDPPNLVSHCCNYISTYIQSDKPIFHLNILI